MGTLQQSSGPSLAFCGKKEDIVNKEKGKMPKKVKPKISRFPKNVFVNYTVRILFKQRVNCRKIDLQLVKIIRRAFNCRTSECFFAMLRNHGNLNRKWNSYNHLTRITKNMVQCISDDDLDLDLTVRSCS